MVFVESLFGMSREFFGVWGYVVVFVTLFLESFPFLGAFIPGGTIALLIAGFLTKLGYFALWKIVLVCIVASITVDVFGYSLGRTRSKGFLNRQSKFFLVKHNTIEKVVKIVHGHTGKSLIFGRMNPITRSIAPFIVGNERVSFSKFLFFSILGSFIWVVCFVFLGYVLGNSYEVIAIAERYILWVGVILLGGFYVYWLGSLFKEYFGRKMKVKDGNNSKK
jgi:membrane-associated protein